MGTDPAELPAEAGMSLLVAPARQEGRAELGQPSKAKIPIIPPKRGETWGRKKILPHCPWQDEFRDIKIPIIPPKGLGVPKKGWGSPKRVWGSPKRVWGCLGRSGDAPSTLQVLVEGWGVPDEF